MDFNDLSPAMRAKIDPLAFLATQRITPQSLGNAYQQLPDLDGVDLDLVHSKGGEGDGTPMSKVFTVSDGNILFYFRITGTYNSWDDSIWDEGYELVKPVEVLVTQYHSA